MFEREDWTQFRSLGTLGQKAGVPLQKIPALVVKELVDNALDVSGWFSAGLSPNNGFYVQDRGPGIGGADEEIASLFSIGRPLTSSKLLRLPTRGAMGNGLRVVAGAVLASGGSLEVETSSRRLLLTPQDDGTTTVHRLTDIETRGTRIEIGFGPSLKVDGDTLGWASLAWRLSKGGLAYKGKTSPLWYDSDSFFELMHAAVGRTVVEVIGYFEGCAHPKAGKIARGFAGRLATSLERPEADHLLGLARQQARVVKPSRLGCVGAAVDGFPASYAKETGLFRRKGGRGSYAAEVPFVIEAWAEIADKAEVQATVNRTPITADLNAYHDKKTNRFVLYGCGLENGFEIGRRPIRLRINIDTPYMPITSDGKAPDLSPLIQTIDLTVLKAASRAKSKAKGRTEVSQKEIILDCLDRAIAKASDGGVYRFSLRQLFYAVRPYVIEARGKEPAYDYFGQVITDYEAEKGEDIPRMYRDSRGTLYHPHTGATIPLGTLNVEEYERPAWTFNKILYCEKEGFFPILIHAKRPERNDCALMTSKGFASRAARDVLDLLGESGEELTFYCIHDADAYGTTIYQALQDGTQARPGRNVRIVNLGLEPEEAIAMGLQVEEVNRKGEKGAPVASYVSPEWSEWLQERRVELNAMTTSQFLAWLDGKFVGRDGKVIPPDEVAVEALEGAVRGHINRRIQSEVLREARFEERVESAYQGLRPLMGSRAATLRDDVRQSLEIERRRRWTEPVDDIAREIADS